MVPLPPVAEAPASLQHSIEVGQVSGGRATNPLWTSQVDNEDFRTALVQALDQARLASLPGTSAHYRLDAVLAGLEQPMLGIDLTVTSTVNYDLSPIDGGEPYRTTVVRAYTASMGEALYAPARLRKANEGAIRENIAAFIADLTSHFAPLTESGVSS